MKRLTHQAGGRRPLPLSRYSAANIRSFVAFAAAVTAVVLGAAAWPGSASTASAAAPAGGVKARIVDGSLAITGTAGRDEIALRLRAGAPDTLQIDVRDDGSPDFNLKRDRFDKILVDLRAGDDAVRIDEVNGVFTTTERTTLEGGGGNDVLVGASGPELLLGGAGVDVLRGGGDNDRLFGGDGDDQVFGEEGNDRMVWNPGDDDDLNEGGDGTDVVEVNGGIVAEAFATIANGTRVRFDRLDPSPFSIDIGTSENLVLDMKDGDDSFSATGNLAALIRMTVDGGAGDDAILGSNGIDLLLGGDGNDSIDGQQGNDVAFLGAGDDVFRWDPGDGGDTVEGQHGTDRMRFNGSGGAELFQVSANGHRVLLTRNLGSIVMDLDDVEAIDLNTLGNTDASVVNDLSGTDVVKIEIDQAGAIGGTAGDAQADTVIVNGTDGADAVDIVGGGTSVSVLGLRVTVDISNSEGANDSLVVNGLGSDDAVTATALPAGVTKLTLDGGAGSDSLRGSQGADVFLGGAGDDFILGDDGNDLALMGADADTFRWDAGDGNDTLEGQDGSDTMLLFGSDAGESVDVVANGGRVLFSRNVDNVTIDLNDVERIDFRALGGADTVTVGDLSGADVTQTALDLRGPAGGGDGQADVIAVNGTQGADVVGAAGDATGILVSGLQATVTILGQEQVNDRLTLNALGGNDVVDATSLMADAIQIAMNGGLGADVCLGGEGGDLVNGGDGADLALMGAGDDTFVWNPGDDNDTVEGQAGTDTMLFNGTNGAEKIDLAANGGRARLVRDVATVVMDLDDVEGIDVRALGGADTVVVNDLTGTDVDTVDVGLGLFDGSGDAQNDAVVVNGTEGPDVLAVTRLGSEVLAAGLAAVVRIVGSEAANDTLQIRTLGGDDEVTVAPDVSALIAPFVDLGADE